MRSRTLALWLAGGLPLLAYVFTSGAHGFWLDSGEFVAAAVRLDIAHPPGHPLSELWSKAFSLLPLGSLTWRVGLGQSFATALAALLLCRALQTTLTSLNLPERSVNAVAVFGAWTAAFTYGLWFQAVRPEVYGLQALCMAMVLERAAALEHQVQLTDARPLYALALALGLGLANHHLIAFTLAPALLPLVVRIVRVRGLRPVAIAIGCGLLALGTYAYLPVRALAQPVVNLGDPSTLANFYWVISAQVYAKNVGAVMSYQPLWERCFDVLVLVIEDFGAPLSIMALLGLYLAARARALRFAWTLALVVLVGAAVRAWVGTVRANPDVLGYLEPAFMAIAGLVAIGVALWLHILGEHSARFARVSTQLSPLLLVLALCALPASAQRASLSRFTATDVFDDVRIRALPPRAVVVASAPQTAFRHWELEATEAARPDVTLVPLSFLGYPGVAAHLLKRQPAMAQLVRGYLEVDQLRVPDLQALAARRPLFVELDPHTPAALFSSLQPSRLFHRVLVAPEQAANAAEQQRALDAFYAQLDAKLQPDLRELETIRQLLWTHYMDAVFWAARGERSLAQDEVLRAVRLQPQDVNVRALAYALQDAREPWPLDPARFLGF